MPPVAAAISAIITGVTEAGAAVAGAATGLAEGIGIPAALAGPIGTGTELALGEGALGAGANAIEGKDPLKGFESGAISGFVGGAGGPLLEGAGLGSTLATTVANAAGGALGNFATGGNPLSGAISGGASGLIASGLHGGVGAPTGGTPAAGAAAPASVPLDPAASGFNNPNTIASGVNPASLSPASGDLLNQGITGADLPGTVNTGASGGSAGSLPGDISGSGAAAGAPASAASSAAGGTAGHHGFLDTLNKNPGLALAGVGLLGDVIKGNQMAPAEKQLNSDATRLGQQGQLDQSYLRSGLLPPGQQAALDAQGAAAKATINSMYASHGTPGSSANIEDIANEGLRQQAAAGDIAMQLYKSGVAETGMSDQVLLDLLNVQLGEDNDLSNAIAKMSTSLAGMGQPIPAGA